MGDYYLISEKEMYLVIDDWEEPGYAVLHLCETNEVAE